MRLAACPPLPTPPVRAALAAKPIVLLGSHLQPRLGPAQRLPVAQVPGHAGQQRGMRNLVAMVGRIRVQHLPMAGVQQPMRLLDCVQRTARSESGSGCRSAAKIGPSTNAIDTLQASSRPILYQAEGVQTGRNPHSDTLRPESGGRG